IFIHIILQYAQHFILFVLNVKKKSIFHKQKVIRNKERMTWIVLVYVMIHILLFDISEEFHYEFLNNKKEEEQRKNDEELKQNLEKNKKTSKSKVNTKS
ncbi:Flavonol synthase/flavanone 3-hydroxylase, partial [Bienertia sinuspersici]